MTGLEPGATGGGAVRPFLSVVVSLYNEEAVLPEFLRRIRAVMRPLCGDRYELIFVDDDSADRSGEILAAEAAANADVRVLTMSRNFGIAECIMAGFRHASGDAVLCIDSDLQDPPELIPRLVEAWQAGPDVDVVHTVRTRRRGESAGKLLLTRIGYRLLRAFSTVEIIPDAGDFKLFSRRAVDRILESGERRPFLRGLSTWVGFGQARVTYEREARLTGDSKCPVLSAKVANYFLDTALVAFPGPLLKGVLYAGLATVAGVAAAAAILLARLAGGRPFPDGAGTVLAVLAVGGVQLVAVGLLGLYVHAIFYEVKNRPGSIVRRKAGFGEPR